MDRDTVAVYERVATEYAARRTPRARAEAAAFADRVKLGLRADLGCGAGRYTADLGSPVVALDAARAMLDLTVAQAPWALPVQADLEALPFARRSLRGAWANQCYQHLPRTRLPMALADLHRSLVADAPVDIAAFSGTTEGVVARDEFPGRMFAFWAPDDLRRVVEGAGFGVDAVDYDGGSMRWRLHRLRTLPDVVDAGMRLLICGLNPSLYAADAGVNFARPGNRFWPAALAAGLVSRGHDPVAALRHHRIGFTDLVKRATVGADALTAEDYQHGLERLRWLVEWLQPAALCIVGLAGWRAAGNRRAVAGRQDGDFAGAPVYLMPNTSGLNAHTRPAQFAEHLRQAAALAG
jgi:TDG/mug DNA glycosylase family protein